MSYQNGPPEPYEYTPPFGPPDMEPDEAYDGQMMQQGFQPGFRPPGPGPWPPGPHPGPGPGPWPPGVRPPVGWLPERWGKYSWPFWGWWGYRLRNAYQDIKHLTSLIQDVVVGMISAGIVAPGPNSPVPGPGGGTGTGTAPPVSVGPTAPANPQTGALWFDTTSDTLKVWDGTEWAGVGAGAGVTDGSNAQPGQIGEFVTFTQNFTVDGTAGGTGIVALGPLGPGDWDVQMTYAQQADWGTTEWLGSFVVVAQPYPTGVGAGLSAGWSTGDSGGGEGGLDMPFITPTVRANITTPTTFSFVWTLVGIGALGTGTAPMTATLMARRMR